MITDNLNTLVKMNIDPVVRPGNTFMDYRVIVNANVEIIFEDIEANLIKHIESHDAVVGCVAWLWNKRIVEALRRRLAVSIVVTKEEKFDRITMNALPATIGNFRHEHNDNLDPVKRLMMKMDENVIDAIRVCGDKETQPLMHNKFLVFLDRFKYLRQDTNTGKLVDGDASNTLIPVKVWMGSFNFTYNATKSLESALVLTRGTRTKETTVAREFFNEWTRIYAISSPLR